MVMHSPVPRDPSSCSGTFMALDAIGHSPGTPAAAAATPSSQARSPRTSETIRRCVVCTQDCSTKPRVRGSDGLYACRECYERTRLHRAASTISQVGSNDIAGGVPAEDVRSAIHRELDDDADDLTAYPAPATAQSHRKPTPQLQPATVEVKPTISIVRRVLGGLFPRR